MSEVVPVAAIGTAGSSAPSAETRDSHSADRWRAPTLDRLSHSPNWLSHLLNSGGGQPMTMP
jgi:hypothetical protein